MKCKRKLFLKQNIIILNKTHVVGTYFLIDGFKNKLKRKNLLRVTQKNIAMHCNVRILSYLHFEK